MDDYESVININDNLWDGDDYFPSLYHVLLQTDKHAFYVAEINNRVVRVCKDSNNYQKLIAAREYFPTCSTMS